MKILGFSKESYKKEYLDSLNNKYLDELACEDEDVIILEDISEFQDYLNSALNFSSDYWWYFI